MKKRVVSVLLVAALAVVGLAACGGAEPGTEAAGTPEATEAEAPAADAAADDLSAEAEAPAAGGYNLVSQDLLGTLPADGEDLSEMLIGEIQYSDVNDGGWAQATHESIVAAMDALGIPEENLITLTGVDDYDQSATEAAGEQLAEAGCAVVFGTSTGYGSYLPAIAAQYPDTVFAQWGTKIDGLVGYEIRSYEAMFLAGYACELMSQDENTQLGYSASYDEFSVRTAINAYALGAKYANEEATVKVACADSWWDPDKESQCAQSLIDAGIKYMGMEASSPAIPETCEANGAYVVGYHMDMSPLAPEAVLVSFQWNFAPIFQQIILSTYEGTVSTDDFYYWGGECASLTDFASFVPAEVADAVAAVAADIASGKVQIYGGELLDDEGNVLVPEGEVMADDDIILQEFFVENVDCAW